MSWTNLTKLLGFADRVPNVDTNSADDFNTVKDAIDELAGNSGSAPDKTVQENADQLASGEFTRIVKTMESDNSIAAGDLVYIKADGNAAKFSLGDTTHFFAVIGICHNIPTNSDYTYPINVCVSGTVRLSIANTSGWTVGDSIYLERTSGNVWNQSTISGSNWFDYIRLGVVVAISTNTYLEIFLIGK